MSLATFKINVIFPCLACYGQKLEFIVLKSRQDKYKVVKGREKYKMGTIFFKSDIYDPF